MRRGARNTIIFLIIRQYYWRTDAPCAKSNGGRNTKKKLLAHRAWSALPIGGGGHRCTNILAHRCTPRHYYWRTDPPCANSISALKKKQSARQQCWCCGGIHPERFTLLAVERDTPCTFILLAGGGPNKKI